ncbi:MAG TPA: hypothetical protein VJ990_03620 [Clostridia bacterium]|nr:hypothetical protein [Clostridia bacterium]
MHLNHYIETIRNSQTGRTVESGKWKEESGKRKVESGKWKVESGKWKEKDSRAKGKYRCQMLDVRKRLETKEEEQSAAAGKD